MEKPGASGSGRREDGTYGGGATGCQHRRGETQTFKTISLFTHIMTNEKSKSGSAAFFLGNLVLSSEFIS